MSTNRLLIATTAAALLCVCTAAALQQQPVDLDALQKTALEESQSGQSASAIRDIQLVLIERPGWTAGWWTLGVLFYTDNQYPSALPPLQHVVAAAPGNASAWALLGLSEFETQDYAHALEHLQRANTLGLLDDAQTERVAQYHLALLLVWNSDFEAASKLLLSSFGSTTLSPELKLALGLATLRVPLLPTQLDPSQEAFVLATGDAAAAPDAPARLTALAQLHPDVPYLAYAAAMAIARAGRNDEAIAWLHKETALSPASPLPWAALANLQPRSTLIRERARATESEQHAAALEHQSASTEKHSENQRIIARYAPPTNAATTAHAPDEALLERAMNDYTDARYVSAIPALEQWLNAHPEDGTAWAVLGLSEYALHQYDGALLHLSRGAKLGLKGSPQRLEEARYTFAVLLIRAGQFDQAAEVLQAVSTGPLTQEAQFARGLALLRRPELPADAPTSKAELIRTAGKVAGLLESSRYDEAFPTLLALIREYPTEPYLHYAYGTALIALSEFDQAAEQMQAELKLTPKSELPLLRLASIALRQHDPVAAASWSKQAVALAPNSADAHYLLGRSGLESGDITIAVAELEIATRLSPASPEIHFNLAKAYTRAKMPEKAERERAIFSDLQQPANH